MIMDEHASPYRLLSFNPGQHPDMSAYDGIAWFEIAGIGQVSATVYKPKDGRSPYISLRKTGYTWEDIGVDSDLLASLTASVVPAKKNRS